MLTRNPNGRGGKLKGRFDDAALYDVIAGLIDAKAAPLTAEDHRPVGQRQAEAMAEVFGYVADHGDTTVAPAAGGRRPHVNVLIRLEDLENRARAACLDFGGVLTPASLRWLCCDACVVPIVLDGAGQPLDVGRATRTIPDGMRRAVAARDRGCAHPGCTRDRFPGAKSTILFRGNKAERRNCRTWSCCVESITAKPTSRSGPCGSPPTGYPSFSPRGGWTRTRIPDANPDCSPEVRIRRQIRRRG